MNLLENYIVKIHSVKDVTDDFIKHFGDIPEEPLIKVDFTSTCYGITKRTKKIFLKSEFDIIIQKGYFMS